MAAGHPEPRARNGQTGPAQPLAAGAPSDPQRMCFYPSLPIPLDLEATRTPPHPCPYLPGRTSVNRGFRCENVPDWAYQALMDAGFRRSGDVFYQMLCPHCRSCVPLRTPVASFRPSRSQRRVWRRNQDLRVRYGAPRATDEKHELYRRYLRARHDGSMQGDRREMEEFLFRSPTETLEVCYRDAAGTLVAVGICDLTPTALSTVYCFFDPAEGRRSPGVYASLVEIEIARRLDLAYYYLGYWVPGCRRMEYKSAFRPAEGLCTDGRWRPLAEAAPGWEEPET